MHERRGPRRACIQKQFWTLRSNGPQGEARGRAEQSNCRHGNLARKIRKLLIVLDQGCLVQPGIIFSTG